MEKINIAEILKDCPSGTKLYSPLCGECTFDRLNMGTIICKKRNTQEITFTSEGYYMLPVFYDCECLLFPSKENRDWNKFQRPFKDGDIVVCYSSNELAQAFIIKNKINEDTADCYTRYDFINNSFFNAQKIWFDRLATEEEKEKLFDAIKTNGYKWNEETKTLEELIEPQFKVGDKVKRKNVNYNYVVTIAKFDGEYYTCVNQGGECASIYITDQNNYELVFDITTLKPYDKVLVRDTDEQKWVASLFSHYEKELDYPFFTVGSMMFHQCIPYEGNEHLLGTTNNCDEFYKNWLDLIFE